MKNNFSVSELPMLKKIIECLPGHIYWKNREGIYLGCNLQQAKSLGFSKVADIIGKTDYDLQPKEIADSLKKIDQEVILTKKKVAREESAVLNGKIHIMRSEKVPLFDERGVIVGIIGSSIDITEEKNLRHEIEVAKTFTERTLKQIIETLPGHVYWYDKQGIFLGCNDQQAKSAGYEHASELIGKSAYEIQTPENAKILQEVNARIFSTGQPESAEEPYRLKDGTDVCFLSKKIPLKNEKGEIIGLLGVSFDITDQKAREKLEAEKIETLKRANETMRFWAGAIAHEIRTPLFSIGMMGEGLKEFFEVLKRDPQLFEDYPDVARSLKYMEKVPKNFEEIIKSVNHFVDMSLMKVSPEKTKFYELKPLEIGVCVQEVMDAYPFKSYRDKSERELVHVNIVDNFTFNGENTLFKHLIYNLMKNAIYFIKKAGKGEIFIDVFQGKPGDPFNYLTFKDTGPGMPKENLQHLFKAFFTRSPNGTGVGLSLCRTIMNEFGGSIACDSVEGEFTMFTMGFSRV